MHAYFFPVYLNWKINHNLCNKQFLFWAIGLHLWLYFGEFKRFIFLFLFLVVVKSNSLYHSGSHWSFLFNQLLKAPKCSVNNSSLQICKCKWHLSLHKQFNWKLFFLHATLYPSGLYALNSKKNVIIISSGYTTMVQRGRSLSRSGTGTFSNFAIPWNG